VDSGRLESFPPVAGATAHTLILGSMPGKASLAAGEYYAHPQNAFWKIMGSLYGFSLSLPYPQRCRRLISAGIAVWDVMRYCRRDSSLDADIVESSIVLNELVSFLAGHPGIDRIFFNGGKAEQTFYKYISPQLRNLSRDLACCRLPSTSPANARLSIAEKEGVWREHLLTG